MMKYCNAHRPCTHYVDAALFDFLSVKVIIFSENIIKEHIQIRYKLSQNKFNKKNIL